MRHLAGNQHVNGRVDTLGSQRASQHCSCRRPAHRQLELPRTLPRTKEAIPTPLGATGSDMCPPLSYQWPAPSPVSGTSISATSMTHTRMTHGRSPRTKPTVLYIDRLAFRHEWQLHRYQPTYLPSRCSCDTIQPLWITGSHTCSRSRMGEKRAGDSKPRAYSYCQSGSAQL